ncbi:hypothetical protein LUZ60_008769 [Juncus effusus]|nr:hypothetical protein LUZ60_008769 [Juncus effusus]
MIIDTAQAERTVEELEEEGKEEDQEPQVEIGPKRMPMDPRLHMAATKGDKALLERLLISEIEDHEGEVVINLTNRNPFGRAESFSRVSCLLGVTYAGETALHIATRNGHFELVKMICNKNRSLLMKHNTEFETPLHYAAKAGCLKSVSFFIELARDEGNNVLKRLLRERNRDGETALYQAILHLHATVVEELLRVDCKLARMADNQHKSPLYLAAMHYSPIVTTLIDMLPPNVSRAAYGGPDGLTALHAVSLRSIGLLQKVLDWKPELAKVIDNSGSTPLHHAASANRPDSVKALLEKDTSSAYISDFSGLFPVHIAAKLGFLQVIKELLEHCPDCGELLDGQGRNFLHIAVEKKRETVVEWVCKYSNLIEVLNVQDNEGDTPMHLAVKKKNLKVFAVLIGNKNVNLCITNIHGLTPRDLATSQLNIGFRNWQNSDQIIDRALRMVGCCRSIHRVDHFIRQHNLHMDPMKEEKEVSSYETMARNMSIVSGLISAAAFSAAFVVTAAHKADILAEGSTNGLGMAFKAFILINSYAFLSSITATILLLQASLSFLDPKYRRTYLGQCIALVKMGTKGFMAAFAVGVYVVLTPVSKEIGILVAVTSSVVSFFTEPHSWPNIFITSALVRREGNAVLLKLITSFPQWLAFFRENVFLGLFVICIPLLDKLKVNQISLFVIFAYIMFLCYILVDVLRVAEMNNFRILIRWLPTTSFGKIDPRMRVLKE